MMRGFRRADVQRKCTDRLRGSAQMDCLREHVEERAGEACAAKGVYSPAMIDLRNRPIAITGASSGIGAATALAWPAAGRRPAKGLIRDMVGFRSGEGRGILMSFPRRRESCRCSDSWIPACAGMTNFSLSTCCGPAVRSSVAGACRAGRFRWCSSRYRHRSPSSHI